MLSEQEIKLLLLLRENARMSVSDLARALNLSRTTVQNRITKLEETGVIKGYSVEYGSDFLSDQVMAHVHIKVKQQLTTKTYIALKQFSMVAELYAISGEYDLIAVVQAESLSQLNQTLDNIGNLSGIERTNSSVILETKFKR
ncbi:Lrp/AsnC family transcriptional regulator [Psychrosphaera sp. 1_MG-2023]|uniref:Lrp/AsnC family transcriptional regulator n=1 Tax=Psychrosphaera sp. 1_MG-2023 TaxID=3062643 RepID=UPI0026E1DC16|nr:Lrp/AsnC family transcriptional regulator [Psychrosphaera sp. 1_MG-2023]MDO6718755.1 Lrp/AsnC family transcriptional regulator [Psychrosphaera sp. 1_MG-2023]